jgi:hypothetical protein
VSTLASNEDHFHLPSTQRTPRFWPPTMRFLCRTGLEIPRDMYIPILFYTAFVAHSSRKAVGHVAD